MSRKLIVEAIGTFFLVMTVGLIVTAATPSPIGAVAIASILMVMVYAGGHISGAHYNPAVTLAVFIRGKATAAEMGAYWVVQFIAGAAGGAVAKAMATGPIPSLTPQLGPGIAAEFMFTFALAYVVLNVATARGTEGNSYYGLAIGFTVLAGALTVGPISGGVFNPAVATGLFVLGIAPAGTVGATFVATFAGGAAAAILFRALDLGTDKPTTATPVQQTQLEQAASTGR